MLARCILREDGRVLAANAAARKLLTPKDGLNYQSDGVFISDENARTHLLGALARRRSTFVVATTSRRSEIVAWVERPFGEAPAAAVFWTPGLTRLARFAAIARHFELSPQQARVAAELVAGRSLERIASKLGVTVATVRSHLKAIYAKLSVTSQSGVVALFVRYLVF